MYLDAGAQRAGGCEGEGLPRTGSLGGGRISGCWSRGEFLGGLWFLLALLSSGGAEPWREAWGSKLLLLFSGQERLEETLENVLICDQKKWASFSHPTFLEIFQVFASQSLSSPPRGSLAPS